MENQQENNSTHYDLMNRAAIKARDEGDLLTLEMTRTAATIDIAESVNGYLQCIATALANR